MSFEMDSVRDISNEKLNFAKTCLIFLMFLVNGLGVGLPGPSFLELQIVVNCSLTQVAYIVPARAFGYVTGSILGGFLPVHYDKQPFILCSFILMSACLGFLPWIRNVIVLITSSVFQGIFMGVLEVCSSVFVLKLWPTKSTSFIQILYLFFGSGALIAPIIAKPYLLPTSTENRLGNSSHSMDYSAEDVTIHYPYVYVSIYSTIVAIMFIVVYCASRESDHAPKEEHNSVAEKSSIKTVDFNSCSKSTKMTAVMLAMMCLHFYFGNVINVGSFLTPYVVKSELRMEKSSGALMTSIFWSTYTFFRLLFVVFNDNFGVGFSLNIEMALQVIGSTMLAYGTYITVNPTMVWLGSILTGLGCSACLALTIGYLQQFFTITGGMISAFLIACCVGEFVIPLVTAQFFDVYPNILILTCCLSTLLELLFLIILKTFCSKSFDKKQEIIEPHCS